jgi:hypothetical protein
MLFKAIKRVRKSNENNQIETFGLILANSESL